MGMNNPSPYVPPGSQPNMNPPSSVGYPQGINYPAGTSSQQGTYGWNAAQQSEASLYNNQPPNSNNPAQSSWVNGISSQGSNQPNQVGSNWPQTGQGAQPGVGGMGAGAVGGYRPETPRPGTVPFRFCTVNDAEDLHCRTMVYQLEQSNFRSANPPGSTIRGKRQNVNKPVKFHYQCVRAIDKYANLPYQLYRFDARRNRSEWWTFSLWTFAGLVIFIIIFRMECMKWIAGDRNMARADVVLAIPGEAYVGREYGLVPLSQEVLIGRGKQHC